MVIKEACVESLIEAVHAQELGADRIELCADLISGGTTPSYTLIDSTKRILKIPIMVMIRPRAGNFIYRPSEIKLMRQSIEVCQSIGVMGVVLGFLDDENQVDIDTTGELVQLAMPLQVTFHKAIDETRDLSESVKRLSEIKGITRILSSGGKKTALEGASVLNRMIGSSFGKITIIAAGKITNKNIVELSSILHTNEFHGRKIVGVL
jgi:copper homeostasis protein